jgi:hypothetical protein
MDLLERHGHQLRIAKYRQIKEAELRDYLCLTEVD